jgi:hypothetical protein
VLFPIVFLVLAAGAKEASCRVGSTTLQRLTAQADAAAVARVDRVEQIGGVRVATATVLRPLKGLHGHQRFAFLADHTWVCDVTEALLNETVLLFLNKPSTVGFAGDFMKAHPRFAQERAERLAGLAFYQIAHAGSGRLSVSRIDGVPCLIARSPAAPISLTADDRHRIPLWIGRVQLPWGMRTARHLDLKGRPSYLVPLQAVEAKVLKLAHRENSGAR